MIICDKCRKEVTVETYGTLTWNRWVGDNQVMLCRSCLKELDKMRDARREEDKRKDSYWFKGEKD